MSEAIPGYNTGCNISNQTTFFSIGEIILQSVESLNNIATIT
jgi:hypothetical protein